MEVEHALGGSEYEDFDSSSSENHSSPSTNSDSAYSATSHPEWALDLGLSIPTLHQSNWAHASPFKAVPTSTHTSTSNFWNPPNNYHQATPEHQEHVKIESAAVENSQMRSRDGEHERETETDDTSLHFGNSSRRSIEMEFDDMINEDSCGPSTGNSPLAQSHSPTMPPIRQHPISYSHISMPAVANSPPSQPHSYLASAGLALQLPPPSAFPSLPGGGIAPSLTGGQPTPPLGSPITNLLPEIPLDESKPASPLPTEDAPAPPPTRPARERRSSARASGLTRSATHSASSSRERIAPSHTNSTLPTDSSSTAPVASGTGVNLVSREAVQVTQLIPNQSNPPPSALTGSGPSSSAFTPSVKLLVLGVPTHGAKSRVETQIKISLSLVRPFGGVKREGSSSSEWAENLINEEGSIDPAIASNELERIGSWSHIQIPKYLALKSRGKEDGKPTVGKKMVNPGPPPPAENTLVLDVAVVRASDPSSQIFICTNCRARELKRSLRKKDPKGKSAPPAALPIEDMRDKDEEEEKRKVVVFNSPEFVEFGTGECVLPTRVTCYCRHHKEKKGFCVTYSLRDHLDNIVASGMTPPIMITDDHKTSVAKNAQAAAAQSTASAAESKRKAPSKVVPPSASTSSIAKKEKVNNVTSAASARSRRAGGRSRRGASESTDATGEEEVEPASKKSKPYDVEARPKKRQSPASRNSPAFAMTPLHSAPSSGFTPAVPPSTTVNSAVPTPATSPHPTYGQHPLSRGTSPVSQHSTQSSFATALGLDGINHSSHLGGGNGGDALMADSTSTVQSPTFIPPASFSPRHSVSTESSLPPQHQAHHLFDWRSNGANSTISTPPLSPGATTPSVQSESFNSLFGSFPSPIDALQQRQHQQPGPPVSSIPSFAIPATEPLQSLTSTWAFQQALQQQQQEIAASMPPPRINRLIPGEGPVSGGIEVTILGENFVRDLTCLFGDSGAVSTHFWSTNTLVCVLPPSANPGPVFVGIKGVLHNPEQGGLPLFTYKDNSDRNLLELALQVVGLKMTGRLEDASAVAMRIVGNSPQGGGGASSHQINGGHNGGAQDTATLAATLNAAAASAYATPVQSRPSSRRTSFSNSPSSSAPVLAPAETRNFEGIVIKFLSLLDLDPSLLPGAAPSLPSASPPISQPNAQHHTLLHLATVLGFHRLVAFLLARGIDFDASDRNGYTALHFAALYGRVAIARHLLDAGADASLKTFAGKTAIEIAQDRDDVDVEDLLLRAAPSPTSTTLEQITPRISSRRPLVSFSPASYSRPTSLYGDSEDEEDPEESFDDEASALDGSSEEGEQSDWSREDSERSWDESSDWPSESEDGEAEGEEEEETSERPIRSRNASTISLHYLLEAEESVKSSSTAPKKVSFPDSEQVDAPPPVVTKPSLSASSSSSWLSKKLKPTVQPGLDKLQPLAGGVTNAWEKAKANRFALPQMHMPELAAFPAMPAALSRRMSSSRRRSGGMNSAGEETDAGEESGWEGASRHWRALYSGQWWHKTPSSPPPQYTPSDSLYLPNTANPDEKISTADVSTASTSSLIARPFQVQKLSRRSRRKLSVVSDDTDDTASVAASEYEEIKHDGNDRMLYYFWAPILLFVLVFAYLNFQVYLAPVIETLADTILPQPLANLLT